MFLTMCNFADVGVECWRVRLEYSIVANPVLCLSKNRVKSVCQLFTFFYIHHISSCQDLAVFSSVLKILFSTFV